ncbi:MAG: hypothetical protein MJZ24_01255 [Paludibacteraceae bacterium]|nr:hypothetical protein [Paludibacteraceae bacterium]
MKTFDIVLIVAVIILLAYLLGGCFIIKFLAALLLMATLFYWRLMGIKDKLGSNWKSVYDYMQRFIGPLWEASNNLPRITVGPSQTIQPAPFVLSGVFVVMLLLF